MKTFVFFTGLISIVSGGVLQIPTVAAVIMPNEPMGMVFRLFAAMAVFLGIILVISARKLTTFGPLVAWEGILRIVGCAVMVWYGRYGDAGALALSSGLLDGIIGLVYLIGLPHHTSRSLTDLLLDLPPHVSER